MSTIAFTCPKCLRRDNLTREKTDPVKAFSATLVCPDCDDGDFHSPEFFDADGRHIDEGTGEAYAAAQALASGGAEVASEVVPQPWAEHQQNQSVGGGD